MQEIKWNTKNNVKKYIYLSENKRNVRTYSAPVCQMVITSAINVPWALKINLTEERKLLVNMAVIINFEILRRPNRKNQKQQKSMTKDYMYMQAKVHHSEAF